VQISERDKTIDVTRNHTKESYLFVPRRVISWIVLLALLAAASCRSSGNKNTSDAGIIVVNAPATGIVKRILAAEGVHVNSGTPVIEIAVQTEGTNPGQMPAESAEGQAVRSYKAADAEIEAARAEAVRHGAEVDRLTPLVAAGDASQGQLDGERALFEKAQRRLQQAQEAKKLAEGGLISARQPNQGNNAPALRQEVVSAAATSSGTVSVIAVRVGELVKAGQPLATLRADQ
jgi:multidrug efflux pump subunit AcrA (membrane-fusion protein)